VSTAPDQFYTGLISQAYGPLRGSPAPVEPYERFVRRHGDPALELGCGPGEPLLDLVASGLDVTGLDSSADMLALCREAAEQRGLQVQLVHQPIESMELDSTFRTIYLAGPTFQLLIDLQSARDALGRIAAHLVPDGRAMVPLFTPQPTSPDAFGRWREHTTDDGEVLAFCAVAESYRADERRVDTTLRYRRGPLDQPIEEVERVWSLRWYDDGEFESMAADARLHVDRLLDHGELGRTYLLGLEATA